MGQRPGEQGRRLRYKNNDQRTGATRWLYKWAEFTCNCTATDLLKWDVFCGA